MSSKNQQKLGFFRDRMSALSNLRNTFQRTSPTANMGAGLIEPEMSSRGHDTTILQQVNSVESQFMEVESHLDQLNGLYNSRIAALTSFADEVQIESQIEGMSTKIAKMLISLKGKITKNDYIAPSKEGAQIQANMQKGYLARMRDLSVRFREMQTNYLRRLDSVRSRAQTASISGSMEDENDIELTDFNTSFTGEQNAMVMENEIMIQRRNEEILRLQQQLDEIKTLFIDLGQLIQEQGTILDRIDNFIETAVDEVKEGNKELEKAETHQKNKCFYVYLIGMIVLILILGVIILIKKGKKSGGSSGGDDSGGDTNTTSLLFS
ncbi:syntaxin 16/TLG2-like protein [Tritrichomonas foetus]|uniref:Syntaxin 16/TLG2-like protein n=1 Tax=Tritrichomonas foetus TaxID=1144522 RepID=A0A1J4KB92_9EUKA|nr:syntaxin 16/TLG2-like protein [Tritrichomonas foetus]|eukprot:OHT08226.1 syntaxin 16/TLG2-like protein [Tritrichomonas foetus]